MFTGFYLFYLPYWILSVTLKKYFKFIKNKSSLNAFPNVSNIIPFKPDLSQIKDTNEYNAPECKSNPLDLTRSSNNNTETSKKLKIAILETISIFSNTIHSKQDLSKIADKNENKTQELQSVIIDLQDV